MELLGVAVNTELPESAIVVLSFVALVARSVLTVVLDRLLCDVLLCVNL